MRPRQSDLRRAVSAAYYAMFHALCETCANSFLGTTNPDRCERAWRQTYRAVNHKFAKDACRRCGAADYNFPDQIQHFAALFITMQEMRHEADYDPLKRFAKSDVISVISSAKRAIEELESAGARHKSAFAAIILLQKRKS